MPTYTLSCDCGREEDVVCSVSAYAGVVAERRCPGCGGRMARVYRAPQVAPDTYRAPRVRASLNSLDGDPGKHPTFESRSAEKAYLEKHNRKFGTEYRY